MMMCIDFLEGKDVFNIRLSCLVNVLILTYTFSSGDACTSSLLTQIEHKVEYLINVIKIDETRQTIDAFTQNTI